MLTHAHTHTRRLDIRVKLTERANAWAAEVGCESNVHFMMSNGTVSFSNILSNYPGKVRTPTFTLLLLLLLLLLFIDIFIIIY
jgi:hypothetical protein